MVVERGEKRLGMLVDSESRVIQVPADVVEAIPEEATKIDDNYIKGVGKLDSGDVNISKEKALSNVIEKSSHEVCFAYSNMRHH